MSAYEGLSHLVEDLLLMSGVESRSIELKVEQVDLPRVITDVVRQSDYRGRIRVEATKDLPPVLVDVPLLKRVLNSLMSSAIKKSQTGQAVDVSVRESDGQVRVDIHHGPVGEGTPSATPSGPGTSSRPDEDFELASHIVRKLVELQEGEFWIGSEEGTVGFSLPAAWGGKLRSTAARR